MPLRHLLGSLLLAASSASLAAPPPQYLFVDDSSPILIDRARALAVWQDQVDDKARMRLQRL